MTENKKPFLSRGRIIRWGIYVALLALVLLNRDRFGCSRIGSEAAEAMHPVLVQGQKYLVENDPAEVLMRDSIVLWQTETARGGVQPHYSRVRGVPGDILRRVGETWAFEDVEGEMHYLPRDLGPSEMEELLGRKLGKIDYFLLNDNRAVDFPDSRGLGFISRRAIKARILPSLFGGSR